ncbi:MAG: hypothetical protein U0793_06590 [Gemmataceae bacterium]
MPPISPVWDWDFREKKRVFFDTKLRMRVQIEGAWHESNAVLLKVEGAKHAEKKKAP